MATARTGREAKRGLGLMGVCLCGIARVPPAVLSELSIQQRVWPLTPREEAAMAEHQAAFMLAAAKPEPRPPPTGHFSRPLIIPFVDRRWKEKTRR